MAVSEVKRYGRYWKFRRGVVKTGIYSFLIFYFLLSVFPVAWMMLTSVKTHKQVYNMPPIWIPNPFTFYNFVEALTDRPFGIYTLRSTIVALAVVIVAMVLGTLGGYGFARFRFPGSKIVFGVVLGSRMIPPISLVVPFSLILVKLNLIDTLRGLFFTHIFQILPLFIWIMKGFFEAIPQDIEDAAKVDGCTKLTAFLRVLLPLTKPGIFAASILSFLMSWNEFLFALTLTRKAATTVPIGILNFFDEYIEWAVMSASTVIAIMPAIVFVIFFQRYIVSGIIAGAMKG